MTTTHVGYALGREQCWCGIWHAIPKSLQRQAQRDGITVYCPLGHSWTYQETEADRLRAALATAERQAASRLARLDQEQARRKTAERKLKRVTAGVCPCCNRTFQNLARHMKGQHPYGT